MALVAVGRRRQEVPATGLDPLHGPPQPARHGGQQDVLGIDVTLGAETAPDVGRDHTHLLLGEPEGRGDCGAHRERDLSRSPDRQTAIQRLGLHQHAAGLDRHRADALRQVRDREHRDHAGLRHGATRVDLEDAGVGVGAPDDRRVEQIGQPQVVHVAAASGEKAPIFATFDGKADGRHEIVVGRCGSIGADPGEVTRMNYRPVEGWGRLPEGWSYVESTSVAVDARDDVYVFNRGEHPVIVFDREVKFLRSWGAGVFRRAHGITIGPDGTLWLTDDLHHTVRQFTATGKLLLTIGDPDTPSTLQGGKPFNRPTHVALCPKTGDIYVSDGYGNSRVHKYDPRGRHLFSWGEPGTDPGAFNLPHNLPTDAEGLVYVADRENHRIQIFDEKGGYLDQWNNLHRPCGLGADRRNGGGFTGVR